MTSDIEMRQSYGGVTLTCDEVSFIRLFDKVCTDSSIASAMKDSIDRNTIQFLALRRRSVTAPSRQPSWLLWVPAIIAGGISAVAFILGYMAIFRWLLKLIA